MKVLALLASTSRKVRPAVTIRRLCVEPGRWTRRRQEPVAVFHSSEIV